MVFDSSYFCTFIFSHWGLDVSYAAAPVFRCEYELELVVVHLLVGITFAVLSIVLIQFKAAVRGEARPPQDPYINPLFPLA